MALLPNKANTEGNNESMGDRTPLPEGKYPVTVTKSEFKQTKAKTGHYLALTCKIFEGPKTGRVTWVNLNLDNPNPVAVEIANKELNSICQALGIVGVEDSVELHEKPFIMHLAIDDSNPNYPGNKVLAYLPYGGQQAAAAVTAPAWAPNTPSEPSPPHGSPGNEPAPAWATQAATPAQALAAALPQESEPVSTAPVNEPAPPAPGQGAEPANVPNEPAPADPAPADPAPAAKKLPWEK